MIDQPPTPAEGAQDEITLLIRRLHETEERLHELTAGEVDAVAHPGGHSYLLYQAQEKLLQSEAVQRRLASTQLAVLNALPAHVALLDQEGVIVAVNESWRRFASANVLQGENYAVGLNYLAVCDSAQGDCSAEAHAVAVGIRSVLRGDGRHFALEYPCHSPTEKRWFRVMVTPLQDGQAGGVVVMHVNVTDRKLTEESLRESEERFRGTFEQAAVGIALVGLDGRFLRVNDRLCAILGFTREELLRLNFAELTAPEDLDHSLQARNDMLAGKRASYSAEKRYRRKSGEIIWANLVTSLERTEAGQPKYFISVLEDITARKLAELRLHRLNRLHTVLSKTGEAIMRVRTRAALYEAVCFVLVEEGRLRLAAVVEMDAPAAPVRLAAAYGEELDYLQQLTVTTDGGPLSRGTIGTALRTGVHDVCNDFATDPRMAPWRDAALARELRSAASFPLKLDGVTIGALVLLAGEAGFFEQDETRLLVTVANDLSFALEAQQRELERAQVELQLRKLSLAVEQSPVSTVITDSTGVIEYVNATFTAVTGFTSEEMLGRHTRILKGGGTPLETYQQLWRTITSGKIWRGELHNRKKNGERFWESVSISPLFDAAGRISHYVAVKEDISQRRQAEEERDRLFNQSLDLLSVAGFEGRLQQVNPAWTQFLGWSAEELTGRPMIEFIHPEDHEATRAVRARIHQGEPIRGFENRYRCRDGSYRWLSWSVHPILELRQVFGVARDVTRDKAAAAALQASEEAQRQLAQQLERERSRLEAAQSVARIGSWEMDLATRAVIWSVETHRIFETAPATFQPSYGMFLQFVHAEDRPRVDEVFQRSLATGGGGAIEHRISLPGDRVKFVEERWQLILDDQGRPVRAIGTCQDVTERRLADLKIRESEERFRLLSKATKDAIWDWDMADDTIRWSDGFERLFGHRIEGIEATLGSWAEHVHQEDKESVVAGLNRALETSAEDWSAEYRFQRRDGSYAYVLDRGYIIRDPNGKAVRMIGGMTDQTERKEAEQRIAEQATLLDIAHEAILVKDLEDRIIYWNKGAERTYGWTAAEARGRVARELFRPDPAQYQAALTELMKTGEWRGELEKRNKSGHAATIEVGWTLVRDGQGQPKSILAINTDITERRKVENQFLRAQRMESIGTLAGGIAHDLNNLLAPILITSQLLQEDAPNAEYREMLQTVQTCAQRGAELVKQVLSFARGVEGERIPLDVSHLLRDIRQVIREIFPKNITAEFQLGRELWPVEGDATQLHQVFMNLCVNARDAMSQGGKLTVAAENLVLDEVYAGMNLDSKSGAYVVVRVEDTGMGIPREIQERIFEPFFTTKEIGKGTGLGLSTTLGILRSHGGFINLYSEPGKGAKFKVYLPARTTPRVVEQTAVEQTRLARGNGELVLVVDDEESVRFVTQKTLERFGYRVLLAANGAEAVARYAQQRAEIAVVLTDMAMPVMDGPATILALKEMNTAVKIIGSSGHTSQGGVAKAVGAGVQHFVPKPYTAETLLKVLADVLARPA
jgi:PAS domain S-box-containing protein